jgi:hypothetical protein
MSSFSGSGAFSGSGSGTGATTGAPKNDPIAFLVTPVLIAFTNESLRA